MPEIAIQTQAFEKVKVKRGKPGRPPLNPFDKVTQPEEWKGWKREYQRIFMARKYNSDEQYRHEKQEKNRLYQQRKRQAERAAAAQATTADQ